MATSTNCLPSLRIKAVSRDVVSGRGPRGEVEGFLDAAGMSDGDGEAGAVAVIPCGVGDGGVAGGRVLAGIAFDVLDLAFGSAQGVEHPAAVPPLKVEFRGGGWDGGRGTGFHEDWISRVPTAGW